MVIVLDVEHLLSGRNSSPWWTQLKAPRTSNVIMQGLIIDDWARFASCVSDILSKTRLLRSLGQRRCDDWFERLRLSPDVLTWMSKCRGWMADFLKS
ncbi:MAG: hypothetical protein CM1200mP18_02080 [Gammaproteobacteria bacterium]|nr:MAG: hypothetical protein CM1200mP18_02080 [Gammaproteobacteria bacterium]